MKIALSVLLALLAAGQCINAECNVSGLQCCLIEFLPLVSQSGIDLSEQRINKSCSILDVTFGCMDEYDAVCMKLGNIDILKASNRTQEFLIKMCSSSYLSEIEQYQECYNKSSETFLACLNKDKDKYDDQQVQECCDYKKIRDCSYQTVEDECGAQAATVIQEEVKNVNGAGLEHSCKDAFEKCGNSASMMASSLIFVALYTALAILLRISI